MWRARGAIAIRAAGIYGPGRGIHQRIANGSFRIPGDGANTVSRIHVDDLAALVDCALTRGQPGSVYVAADDAPVPQIEAIRFVCTLLGVGEPPRVPLEQASETLRHDRRVRNARAKRDLDWSLRYPTFREGFRAVMAADGLIPAQS
jgi:nucleoside-diphosphate-sugar epimerase